MSVNGLSYDVILQMVERLQNQGYVVYTDSFYSSPALFKELVNNGLGAVGTMDPTRRECPDVLKDQRKKWYVQHIRGDMECGLEMELCLYREER